MALKIFNAFFIYSIVEQLRGYGIYNGILNTINAKHLLGVFGASGVEAS